MKALDFSTRLRRRNPLTRRSGIYFLAERRPLIIRHHASTTSSSSSSSRPEILRPDHPPQTPFPPRSSPPVRNNPLPAPQISIWKSVKSAFGFSSAHKIPEGYTPAPFTVETNPFRAKKTWPPQFDRLTPRHRFHFEKTYRRRAKLKYACPGWKRGVTIVQNVVIVGVVVYFVFFLDLSGQEGGGEGTPFDGIRKWVFGHLGSVVSKPEGVDGNDGTQKGEAVLVKEKVNG